MTDFATIKVHVEARQRKEVRRLPIKHPFQFSDLIFLVHKHWSQNHFVLKYKDDEGDLCTLDEESFTDFRAQHDSESRLFRLSVFDKTAAPNPNMCCMKKNGGIMEYAENASQSACVHFSFEYMAYMYRINEYSPLWLPMLSEGVEKAVLLQSCNTGTSLRHLLGGVDAWGCVGAHAVFHAKGVGTDEQSAIVTLKNDSAGYLRVNPTTGALEIGEDGEGPLGEEHKFQIVPCQDVFGSQGFLRFLAGWAFPDMGFSQLCSKLTGELINVSEDGAVTMVNALNSNKMSTAFMIRYHAGFDMSWRDDPTYQGKRRHVCAPCRDFFTFEQFVDFVREKNFKTHCGESGVLAAKVMWAEAVEEGCTQEEVDAVMEFTRSLWSRRYFGLENVGPQYSFGEMLAFIEARALTTEGRNGLEGCKLRWKLLGDHHEGKNPADMAEEMDFDFVGDHHEGKNPADMAEEMDFHFVDAKFC